MLHPSHRIKPNHITFILLVLSATLFILQNLSQLWFGIDILIIYGAKINAALDRYQLWRLLTPVFLHASILHIGFNMYALYVLGPSIERIFGRWLFLALYLLSGCYGNLFSYWFTPGISLGASTAVFGLIAAQAVFIYRNREFYGPRARPLLTNIGMILLVNLFLGLSPGIDNWGHMGGLLGGLAFSWFTVPRLGVWESESGNRIVAQLSHQPWKVVILMAGIVLVLAMLPKYF